ncbi:acyltransferase family protein [Pontixanthobacter aquaemixtae]|uniref:Acyltransferase family protein n=1 Tax=Pontixanthobacter aquaemixtae TaxID=1958940 RepID=A0A844ZQR9_9SPHN|nr:acyltransferase family protein [Pontixanthobacter aquaemixtae]MXO89420.1 acyltransferase family protein [Pontixanthobacter aquaemixtae]
MSSTALKYRAEIDGIRAIAVVSVILFHAGFAIIPGGFLGVDVFFVISGFLITSLIIKDLENDRFSLLDFWNRRARRILPALILVLTATIVPAWLLLFPRQLELFGLDLAAATVFVSNIRLWMSANYFSERADFEPLIHLWSLGIEEQFYLLFPIFMIVMWRWFRKFLLASLLLIFASSLVLAEWLNLASPAATFYLLPMRAWELVAGSLIAWMMTKHDPQWSRAVREGGTAIGLTAILLSFALIDESMALPGFYTLPTILGTMCLLVFASEQDLIAKIFTARPMVWIGLLSYSAYLWHQPLFAFARTLTVVELSPVQTASLIAATFALALGSYRFVEQPTRDREKIRTRPFILGCFVCLLTLAGVALWMNHKEGYPTRFSPDQLSTIAANRSDAESGPCDLESDDQAQALVDATDCYVEGKTLYLFGDSHAREFQREFYITARANGFKLVSITSPGCFPIPGTRRLDRPFCENLVRLIPKLLSEHPAPAVFITRWRLHLTGERYDNGEGGIEPGEIRKTEFDAQEYASIYENVETELTMLSRSAPLIVVDQIPETGWHVPKMMIRRTQLGSRPKDGLSTSYDRYLSSNAENIAMFDRLASNPRINVVRTAPLICDKETRRCLNERNGSPLYFDDDHATKQLNREIATETMRRILTADLGSRDLIAASSKIED